MNFEEIYQEYGTKILNLAYRMTGKQEVARDLTQDIFMKVLEKQDSFRGDSQVYTWLYRVATNHILNYLKREKRARWLNLMDKSISDVIREDLIDPDFWGKNTAPAPDRRLEASERETIVWKMIQKLPPKHRMPLVLHRYEDMSYQEIADNMGISLSAVETRIHRAKKELVRRLEPYAGQF